MVQLYEKNYLLRRLSGNRFVLPSIVIVGMVIIAVSFFFDDGTRGAKAPTIDWELLGQVKFNSFWYAPYKANVHLPVFPDTLNKLNGRQIEITGYFIPMELNGARCALSKNPNRTCFFCGKATIETIMIVEFKKKAPNFGTDDLVTVTGRLKTARSFNDFIFHLLDARFVRVSH